MKKTSTWLLIPLIASVMSGLIFIGQSSDVARLNRRLSPLKYTDFISIWWQNGDNIEFICVPDDAEKVMRDRGISIPPKQAVYTTFTLKLADLLGNDNPADIVKERYRKNLHGAQFFLSPMTWDTLFSKAQLRHFRFSISTAPYIFSGFTAILSFFVLIIWWKKSGPGFMGVFICLISFVFFLWWSTNPVITLSAPDTETVWAFQKNHI